MPLLPYLALPDETPLVQPGAWERVDGPRPLPFECDLSDHWDYNTPVRMRRSLTLDWSEAMTACALPEETELRASAIWSTSFQHGRASGRQLVGTSTPIRLDRANPVGCIELDLPSPELAARVEIRTVLTLVSRPEGAAGVGASRPGSRLWGDQLRIVLEGQGARLPVCQVSFKDRPERFGGSRAAWMVHISRSALNQHVSAGVVVFLNADNAENLPLSGDTSPLQRTLMRLLQADVARQLLEHALEEEDFLAEANYEEETLGASVLRLLDRVFPDMSVPDVGEVYRTRRSYFQARLQHTLDVLGGGTDQ